MGQISEISLFIPKFSRLEPFTEAASNEIKVMASQQNISGMFELQEISNMLRHHDVISQRKKVSYILCLFCSRNLIKLFVSAEMQFAQHQQALSLWGDQGKWGTYTHLQNWGKSGTVGYKHTFVKVGYLIGRNFIVRNFRQAKLFVVRVTK